jgi:hypothetical protein
VPIYSPAQPRTCSAVRPPRRGVAVKMMLLPDSTNAAAPQWVTAVMKVSMTSKPVVMSRAWLAMASREWSSTMSKDFDGVIGELPMGDVGLPTLVGHVGSDPFRDERGRLWVWGTTKPRRCRMRQTVYTAGTGGDRRVGG